jgi:peptidoglycan/xylan/chitin deacetylase (PgdA/CDA1 family)
MHISGLGPFGLIKYLARVNPLIVNYHVVSDKRLPHIVNLYKYRSISGFNHDLDFLTRNFNFIDLEKFLQYTRDQIRLPENALLLTFDDGLREVYDIVAPILETRNIPATFFLTSNFLDNQELGYDHKKSLLIDYLMESGTQQIYDRVRSILNCQENSKTAVHKILFSLPYDKLYLIDEIARVLKYNFDDYLQQINPYISTSQVKDMLRRGFTFGAHGIDHARFSEISLKNQINQAVSSTKDIVGKFSLPYKVFAFPYSDDRVSMNFFRDISHEIEAPFGTHGLLNDEAPSNFQRISLEKFGYRAKKVLKFHFTRKIVFKVLGRDKIKRTYTK